MPIKYEIDYIYALIELPSRTKFYIGRTIDPKRRIGEHRSGARNYKDGDELKYLYASSLNAMGIEWEMEILDECSTETEFYEDYYINKYRSEPLQNMRSGDTEPWMGRDYSSPTEFLLRREKIIEEELHKKKIAKIRQKNRSNSSDAERTLFAGEDPNKRFVSPAYEAILKRRKENGDRR